MENSKKLFLSILSFLVTLGINALGAFGKFNNMSQKAVSDKYPTLITPSPMTFSIWGLIYGLLFISLIILVIKRKERQYEALHDNIASLFWFSCLLNSAWIVAFSYEYLLLSTVLILLLTLSVSLICKRLISIENLNQFLSLTFGLYTGWLIIASVVNIAATLVKAEWNRFGLSDSIWTIITLCFALILVYIVMSLNRNAIIAVPVAWAYYGISQVSSTYSTTLTLYIGIVVLILMTLYQFFKNQWRITQIQNTKVF